MLAWRLPLVAAALAFLGVIGNARSESALDSNLLIDPWAKLPLAGAPHDSWWEPATEIVDPWAGVRAQAAPRDELEIVDPWRHRHRRVPTACYPDP